MVICRSPEPLRIAATCDPVAMPLRAFIGSQPKHNLLFRVKCDHMTEFVCGRLYTITLTEHE
jgi:hypothetical protein